VAAGSALNELRPDAGGAPIPARILDHGHRSGRQILDLAAAIQAGDEEAALRAAGAVSDANLPGVLGEFAENLFFTRKAGGHSYAEWLEKIRSAPPDGEGDLLPPLAELLGGARILTAARQGPLGCEGVNRLLRRRLQRRFDPEADNSGSGAGFHGAPLLITRNDDRLGLANGEIGVWLRRGGRLEAYVPRPEKWLRLPAAFLPPQEPAFAVTVHKSQGSECDEALIVLPEAGHRLLSREILYTAVTRARRSARIFASEAALREAVRRRLSRPSGLRDYFLS
jgi:exodeoxyribonuclease V alpha subunit